MTTLNIADTRARLQAFEFKRLFIEELGWSNFAARPLTLDIGAERYTCAPVAQLAGVAVFEVASPGGGIPDAKTRAAAHAAVERLHHENLLIFVDAARTQSLWYWVKREGSKKQPRSHTYFKGQPGDLFLGKLNGMHVDIGELDADGSLPVTEVAQRLKAALDVERATRKFFGDYDRIRLAFLDKATGIQGIADERDRQWYVSVLLNRIMFVWFLQKQFMLDGGNADYLPDKLARHLPSPSGRGAGGEGGNDYYTTFLKPLFFEGFAKPEDKRSVEVRALIGDIKYLNGGLFIQHPVEARWPDIHVPDVAFATLFEVLGRYTWHLDDAPGASDSDMNPAVLGYIFEKYINQKEFGAYYTRPEITEYLCEQTIHRVILDAVNRDRPAEAAALAAGLKPRPQFESMADLLMGLDAPLCAQLLFDVLPRLSLLDPACGSGAFLVAAMKTLIDVYAAVIGRISVLKDAALSQWLSKTQAEHNSIAYFIKREIITRNLYGVDIMEEAVEIARLRLFLALVASAQDASQLEPLPNIDFNILPGNSLIGLLRVDETAYEKQHRQNSLFYKPYDQLVKEKNELVAKYRNASNQSGDLTRQRDEIDEHRQQANAGLNELLLNAFTELRIKFEQATWDDKQEDKGKPKKRAVTIHDIAALKPFHWGYEFDEVMNGRGGFDAIITNPPWEIFKPQAKEFFADYSGVVTKNTMTIKDFEKEQGALLKNKGVRAAWLEYQSRFPHVSAWFRAAPQFANQISIVNGKKAGSDVNLYKLFTEQCFNLLRDGGECGIVIPSGIYTDLGTKQLREMLFAQTQITGLFGFENRRMIFENVDSRFKFVVLSFRKGEATDAFPAAFMRHDVDELDRFPREGAMQISVPLVRTLSPDSLSIMEFKSDLDVQIAEKMLRFPLLGERIEGVWNLKLTAELHMTNDSALFKTQPGKGHLPLCEGKMIHQFDAHFAEPRYWVDEREGRKALLGKEKDAGQVLDYQQYRLGFRDVARNTDERTMISTLLPHSRFTGNTLITSTSPSDSTELLAILGLLNSFTVDWTIRLKVTTHCNMFYVYQLPVPRLTAKDAAFRPIVERAARLVCTTPEFDALWAEVGKQINIRNLRPAIDTIERSRLRAELDGLVARLYGLTEVEFAHILNTFPLVPEPVKTAAQNAYRDVERGLIT